MKKFNLTAQVIVFFILVTQQASAVEYLSPRVLGLGGSGRAAPMLNDAIYLNPSYASFAPVYSISGGYTWFDQGRNYNISVQDSRTEMFQAGAAFTRREQNSAINLGASKSVIQQLGFGLGSKILIDDRTNKMTSDFMFSTSYIGAPWVYSSLVIDNIIEGSEATRRNLYRTLYLGFKFIPLKEIQIYLDPLYSPSYSGGNKAGYNVGAEFSLLADFFFRMGKFTDGEVPYLNTRGDGFGLGLGWIGPKINFDYAMHRVTSAHSGAPLTTANSFSLTIFI
jgi:hypothetical protein